MLFPDGCSEFFCETQKTLPLLIFSTFNKSNKEGLSGPLANSEEMSATEQHLLLNGNGEYGQRIRKHAVCTLDFLFPWKSIQKYNTCDHSSRKESHVWLWKSVSKWSLRHSLSVLFNYWFLFIDQCPEDGTYIYTHIPGLWSMFCEHTLTLSMLRR